MGWDPTFSYCTSPKDNIKVSAVACENSSSGFLNVYTLKIRHHFSGTLTAALAVKTRKEQRQEGQGVTFHQNLTKLQLNVGCACCLNSMEKTPRPKIHNLQQSENSPWNITLAYFPGMAPLKPSPRRAGGKQALLQPWAEVIAPKLEQASTQFKKRREGILIFFSLKVRQTKRSIHTAVINQ